MASELFRKCGLIAAASIMVSMISCSDLVVNPSKSDDNMADFQRAWTVTDSIYPYFSFKHINWDSIYTVYKPQAEAARGDEIFQVLFNMLAELKDGHVEVQTMGGFPVGTYTPPRKKRDRDTFSPLVVRKYFKGEVSVTGGGRMEYGIMPGNIGYVRIATFENGSWIHDFDNILDYMRDTKALIIDVRGNGGGSTNQGDFVISRLLTSALPYAPAYFMGKLLSPSPLRPAGAYRYHKPVAVLMNGTCFSAAEDFLNEIGQVPTVTLVGDTSAGASGFPQVFTLPGGMRIRISTHDYRRYDGRPIEWNGIVPDVLVMQTKADAERGRDLQLERAVEILK